MSEALRVAIPPLPKQAYSSDEMTHILDNHESRIAAIEAVGEIIVKIYDIMKKGGVILIGWMALTSAPESPVGHFLRQLNEILPK